MDHESEQLIDEGVVVDDARKAIGRARAAAPGATQSRATRTTGRKPPQKRSRRTTKVPGEADLVPRMVPVVGPRRAERLATRVAEAADDFVNERYDDAARLLTGVVKEVPDIAEVHELLGLVRYRQGRWRPAIRELEKFRLLSGSVDQHAVLADCHRALGHHTEVAALWDELRQVSPDAALVTEGRIVAAGDLADQGRVDEAIAVLAKGWRWPQRVQAHHLRRAYALADLYERAGDFPAARALFVRVAEHDAQLGDAAARARALR